MNKFALSLLLLALPAIATAQEKKPFRWGTDPTGGAPFVYQDADRKFTGFEWDLAAYFAKKLGREPKMVAGDWSNLPLLLDKSPDEEGGIDVVMNGYELNEDLAQKYAATRPYFIFKIVLMARRDNPAVRGWSDLYRRGDAPPKTVGVLGGTAAQQYLDKTFGKEIDLRSNTDVANVIELVDKKRLDATVQDTPAATYFLKEYPDLVAAGERVRSGYYVLYCRKSDPELQAKLDAAIAAGIKDGTFQKIYYKYGLWTEDQERLRYWQDQPWPPPFQPEEAGDEDKKPVGNQLTPLIRELVEAAWVTIKLSFLSFPLAMAIGLVVGVGRVYGPGWLRVPLTFYVEVIRGTPLLLQLFMIYYLVPDLLRRSDVGPLMWLAQFITPMAAGVLGLAINYSAYEAENYRAGLLAIPKGQMEAALALGMSRFTAIRRVIVPQAIRIVIPPVTNDFIALFKDTAACSTILVVELTRKYNELFNFNRSLIIELAFITAGLYLLMSYPLSVVARRLENRLAGKGGRP